MFTHCSTKPNNRFASRNTNIIFSRYGFIDLLMNEGLYIQTDLCSV